nr:pseudaminic acid biosynthesis-associated methylase [Chlorobium phaeovibrioides]
MTGFKFELFFESFVECNFDKKWGGGVEFGCNVGMNLKALQLLSSYNLHGIEINDRAVKELAGLIPEEHIHHTSILDYLPEKKFELVLIKGVLIHINPDELNNVYSKLVSSCGRYLLVAEYYNPSPVKVTYRGHNDRLFKRDFAGEIMDGYPQMRLIDYGFFYHRDPVFPQDDVSWFLMEKSEN